MNTAPPLTLVNPQNGHLSFRLYAFEDNSFFDHVQRLNYYTIILANKGAGLLKSDFSDYRMAAPAIAFFAPYQPFMLSAESISGIVINFHPDFFCIHKHQQEVACNGVLFNNIYDPPLFSITEKDVAVLQGIYDQMYEEVQQSALAQHELLVSYLKIFLIHASRLKLEQNPEKLTESSAREPFVLQRLKDAIEVHFKTKHAPGDYASILNISPNALARITRNHFHKTLTHLIADRIVIEAKRELYLTAKPVKSIAYELGFGDEYYFSRFFKKNAAISPQIYRETVGFARAG